MPDETPSQRHDVLDEVRGFAVLAMFAVNIQLFALVWIAADIPGLQGDFNSWGDRAVWLGTQTFISQAPLALVAMIVVAANGMTLRGLWGLGLGLIGFTGLMLLAGSAIGALIGDSITAAGAMGFNPEAIADIEALYRTGFMARLGYNMSIALQSEMMQIVFMSGRIAGCLLLGMAGLRSGFLTGTWPARRYGWIAAMALALGVLVCLAGAWNAMASGFSPAAVLQNRVAQYFGSLALALGYAAGFMLAAKLDLARAARSALAAVGRMPISNYFAQTLLMTLLFVGFPGLGQFGQIDRTGLALILVSVWVAQVFGSIFWLQRYRG